MDSTTEVIAVAVPTKNQLHRPVLEIVAESNEPLSRRQVVEFRYARLALTAEDMGEQSSSGVFRVADRTDWAMFDLRGAGYLHRPSRGRFLITNAGRTILQTHQGEITDADLRSIIAAQQSENGSATPDQCHAEYVARSDDVSPSEQIRYSFQSLQDDLAQELLDSIANLSPDKFEILVVRLLESMGYGEGVTVGRSGDGGIDGIINQDALGLEKVYVQAKRWSNQVGEPEIRNFSGSLDPFGATKGVFITTSTFSNTARQTAQTISAGSKFIRLVDGNELAQLMIRHGVGVVTEYTYEIKKLDENYFAEDI